MATDYLPEALVSCIADARRKTATTPPPSVRLQAGPAELWFEPESGWIRQIHVGNREVIRAIYGAVRDRNWRTVPVELRDLTLEQSSADSFNVRFVVDCLENEIHLVWQGLIVGTPDGIRFEFHGKAESSFLRNRIGLCVLIPVDGYAGQPCMVKHSDGAEESATFPNGISPHQPFYDIKAIRLNPTEAHALEVRFEGDVFEMEDQRNWTDASYKIYSTPLSRPLPAEVNQGDSVVQSVNVRFLTFPTAGSRIPLERTDQLTVDAPCVVDVDFEGLCSKPAVGLGFSKEVKCLGESASQRLRALKLDHIRVDCRLYEADWLEILTCADEQAQAAACGLHIAVYLSGDEESELRQLHRASANLASPIRLWLVFLRDAKTTPSIWVKRAREILSLNCPTAQFAAGTDINFAELNRERPEEDADWLPCCPMNPQLHACDNLTIIENLPAQTDVVRTVKTFSSQPLVVSPITLALRMNPKGSQPSHGPVVLPTDSRQSSLFAAGWTLGSFSALTASNPVHSLTYFETIGPRGIIDLADQATVFPVYHVFAALLELNLLAGVHIEDPKSRLRVSALAGVTSSGQSVVWVANHTSEVVRVRIESKLVYPSLLIKHLNEHSVIHASREPEAWWLASSVVVNRAGQAPSVDVPRFGLVRLEFVT